MKFDFGNLSSAKISPFFLAFFLIINQDFLVSDDFSNNFFD